MAVERTRVYSVTFIKDATHGEPKHFPVLIYFVFFFSKEKEKITRIKYKFHMGEI